MTLASQARKDARAAWLRGVCEAFVDGKGYEEQPPAVRKAWLALWRATFVRRLSGGYVLTPAARRFMGREEKEPDARGISSRPTHRPGAS